MEVTAEARRIMVVALGKLYSSRTQRGGLRLHRSLLLTLVMKSARDICQAARAETEAPEEEVRQLSDPAGPGGPAAGAQGPRTSAPLPTGQPRTASQVGVGASHARKNSYPEQQRRKRRGQATAEPDFLPCKKAKLERESSGQPGFGAVLTDYLCGTRRGSPPTPIPLQVAVAAC
ncbi:immediate early response gene 2 protein-like [Pholidichthys leucotaenia]